MINRLVVEKILAQINSALDTERLVVAFTYDPRPGFSAWWGGEHVAFEPARPGQSDRDTLTRLLTALDVKAKEELEANPLINTEGVIKSETTPKRRGRPKKESDVTEQTTRTNTEKTD